MAEKVEVGIKVDFSEMGTILKELQSRTEEALNKGTKKYKKSVEQTQKELENKQVKDYMETLERESKIRRKIKWEQFKEELKEEKRIIREAKKEKEKADRDLANKRKAFLREEQKLANEMTRNAIGKITSGSSTSSDFKGYIKNWVAEQTAQAKIEESNKKALLRKEAMELASIQRREQKEKESIARVEAQRKQQAMKSLQGMFIGINKLADRASFVITATLSYKLWGTVTEGIRTATEESRIFEKKLVEINSLLTRFDDDFRNKFMSTIKAESIKMAVASGRDLQEVLDGLYMTISAGRTESAESALASYTETIKLATVANADMVSTTDALQVTLNNFRDELGSVEEASDSLFKMVQVGKTTLQEFANGWGKVASTAGGMNIPLKTVANLFAVLTQVLPTREALTGLAQALVQIQKSTEATTILREEGVKGFVRWMETLDEYSAREIFTNTRAYKSILGLMNNKEELYKTEKYFLEGNSKLSEEYNKVLGTQELRLNTLNQIFKKIVRGYGSEFNSMLERAKILLIGLATSGKAIISTIASATTAFVAFKVSVALANVELKKLKAMFTLAGGATGWLAVVKVIGSIVVATIAWISGEKELNEQMSIAKDYREDMVDGKAKEIDYYDSIIAKEKELTEAIKERALTERERAELEYTKRVSSFAQKYRGATTTEELAKRGGVSATTSTRATVGTPKPQAYNVIEILPKSGGFYKEYTDVLEEVARKEGIRVQDAYKLIGKISEEVDTQSNKYAKLVAKYREGEQHLENIKDLQEADLKVTGNKVKTTGDYLSVLKDQEKIAKDIYESSKALGLNEQDSLTRLAKATEARKKEEERIRKEKVERILDEAKILEEQDKQLEAMEKLYALQEDITLSTDEERQIVTAISDIRKGMAGQNELESMLTALEAYKGKLALVTDKNLGIKTPAEKMFGNEAKVRDSIQGLAEELLELAKSGALTEEELKKVANAISGIPEEKTLTFFDKFKEQIKNAQTAMQYLGQLNTQYQAMISSSFDLEIQQMQKTHDKKMELLDKEQQAKVDSINSSAMTEKQKQNAIDKVNSDYEEKKAKEEEKIEKELSKRRKEKALNEMKFNFAMQLGNMWMNVFGHNWNPATSLAIGAIMTGLMTGMFAKQYANASKMELAEGGVLRGKSHAQGGIPLPNGNIVEGKEIILTKKVSENPMLATLASMINYSAGGKDFAGSKGILRSTALRNNARVSERLENSGFKKVVDAVNKFKPVVLQGVSSTGIYRLATVGGQNGGFKL